MHLFRAEQTQGDRPGVHCQIGRVYLSMQRWDDAERAFGKALERDEQHIDSQCGMAETRLGQQRYREAVDTALRAIDLDSTRQQAHYLLGAALLGDGQAEIAAEVFETCLKLNPNHVDAHKKLAEACEVLGDTSAASQHRDIAQKLESAALLQQQLSDYRRKP
jgi:cytochrome c-type biogenesis protein CcmH/NrfG